MRGIIIMTKYKLDIKRDLDITPNWNGGNEYFLWLPFGYRFADDLVHCRGFDTLAEVRAAARRDVIECDCGECAQHERGAKV
jgi:hypothetical protein